MKPRPESVIALDRELRALAGERQREHRVFYLAGLHVDECYRRVVIIV